jgi:hypothetical protein
VGCCRFHSLKFELSSKGSLCHLPPPVSSSHPNWVSVEPAAAQPAAALDKVPCPIPPPRRSPA